VPCHSCTESHPSAGSGQFLLGAILRLVVAYCN
jgi:hypothetical protein